MKVKLDKEENVLVVYCERKKANLKIIYKDMETDEVIKEDFIENLNIGQELDVELTPPKDYEIIEKKENKDEKKIIDDTYDKILKEMQEFRKQLGE